jgi:uncharacterized protein YjbI with pentapeptide repeats
MARPWLRWISKIAIAIGVGGAALALPWVSSNSWFQRWWLSWQWNGWTLVAIAIDAALVLAAAIWWLWWRLPRRQVERLSIQIPDPKARADAEDNFRKTVGQALGGAAVLIGAGAAYLQFSQQQQTANQQIVAQQKIATDQITAQQQAAEVSRKVSQDLLISNQVAKGFEQLAGKERSMRLGGIYGLEGVMNTSEQYHQPVLETLCAFVRDRDITTEQVTSPLPTDVKAAVSVIGRRKPGSGIVDLAGSDIRGTDLSNADLNGARLNDADLTGASLFISDLTGADLSRAKLNGAHLDAAILTGAQLGAAILIDAKLDNADLRGAALRGGNLHRADLAGAILRAVEPDGSSWIDATLSESDLSDADLRGADLSGANLTSANLTGARLEGAYLTSANLSGAKGLSQEQLDKACGAHVTLPDGNVRDLKPCPEPPVAPPLNQGGTP